MNKLTEQIMGIGPYPPWQPKQYPDGSWGIRNAIFAISNIVPQDMEDRENGIEKAIAYLIASSPELLYICKILLSDLAEAHQHEIDSNHYGDGPDGCSYCKDIKIAKSIIAKIELAS